MFISKKHLSRRTFLRGAGATVALPLLEGMIPARTALAQTAARPVQRFGFIYVPHGSIMAWCPHGDQWTPAGEGTGFEFTPILKPLEPLREYVNVLTGLAMDVPNGHTPSIATWLTGVPPAKGSFVRAGTSVDQVMAGHIGQSTSLPSMEFATEHHSSHLGSCAGNYLCAYMGTMSWRTPTQAMPMESNPRVIFERMFGGDAATPEARRARLERHTSILDAVAESVTDLRLELGAPDQAKLSEYLDNVREIERRIQQAEKQRMERLVEAPPPPVGVPESFEEHVDLMFELQALAWQGDLTRVITFMLARELSTLSYPQLGVADGHHPISHNSNVPEQVAKKAKVDTYHVALFARFLERLRATPEGDGNLLDHAAIMYGSGMSNGNAHDKSNLPILLVGGGAGWLKGGRHIRYADRTPLANLKLTLLNRAGIPMDGFGNSTGTLEL